MPSTVSEHQPEQEQLPALRRFFKGLIDYSGLFPPSALPLDPAIRNFARYRSENDHWMLARFVITATKLPELAPYGDELFSQNPPFRFSVVTPGGDGFDSFLDSFRADLLRVRDFEREHGDRVTVEILESKLPLSRTKPEHPETLVAFFETVERAVLDELGRSLPVFFEVPWDVHSDEEFGITFEDGFDHASDGIAWYNKQPREKRILAGMKLRCGHVKPELTPPVAVVASAIHHAVRAGIPFKATAGLHHPVRHFRGEYGGMMHGFFNVFGAGILARAHGLNRDRIEEIVREENPAAFTIGGERFAWRDLSASLEEIDEARQYFTSYGSCSFDEPREDLESMKLLR